MAGGKQSFSKQKKKTAAQLILKQANVPEARYDSAKRSEGGKGPAPGRRSWKQIDCGDPERRPLPAARPKRVWLLPA
jgi:hypothetical protein